MVCVGNATCCFIADHGRIHRENTCRQLAERGSNGGNHVLSTFLVDIASQMDAPALSQHMFGYRCSLYGGRLNPTGHYSRC